MPLQRPTRLNTLIDPETINQFRHAFYLFTLGVGQMPQIQFNRDTQRYELVYTEAEGGVHPDVGAPFEVTEDVTEATPANCACESCKAIRRDPTAKLRRGTVHMYSYRPTRWRLLKTANDPDAFHFGVELETDNYVERNNQYARLDNEQAVDMRRPKNMWLAKSDSSVSGPEFVSHPATMAYWRAHSADLKLMFKMLLHAGFRSHDNDKCGMHINISRNAFDSADHLYRFLTLLHAKPAWALSMSQRSADSAQQWAPLSGLDNAHTRREVADLAFTNSEWRATTGKYSALNIPPAEQGRMEFRLPRGTLRFDRFMKNLEWTHGMVQYTRGVGAEDSVPADFMAFVREQESTYPNLKAFIDERGDRLTRLAAGSAI